MPTREEVINVLKEIYDPEIPVNIWDLGLIYGIEIDDGKINIRMTLTAPGCPLANVLAYNVEEKLKELPGVEEVKVQIVWEPPWSVDRISEEGKKILRSYGYQI